MIHTGAGQPPTGTWRTAGAPGATTAAGGRGADPAGLGAGRGRGFAVGRGRGLRSEFHPAGFIECNCIWHTGLHLLRYTIC